MIPREIFYERRDRFCRPCEFWRGACLKGHNLASTAGCPVRKFPGVQGAEYATDRAVNQTIPEHKECCNKSKLPPTTWAEVSKQFMSSVVAWIKSGLALTSAKQHGFRYGRCQACDRFKEFYCTECKCVAYIKAKLLTEKCPLGKW